MKLRKSGPAFVPIIHQGKALGVKFQSDVDAQAFLESVQAVQETRLAGIDLDNYLVSCDLRSGLHVGLFAPQIIVSHDIEVAEDEEEDSIEEARVDMMNDMNLIKKEIYDIKHILVVIETKAKMVTLSA